MRFLTVISVISAIFLSGCFIAPRRTQIYMAGDPNTPQEYTPISKVQAIWRMNRVEGTTRLQLRNEARNGYTSTKRCQTEYRHHVIRELLGVAAFMPQGNAIIGAGIDGRYRGGYRRRRLECRAQGELVRVGSEPMRPRPSVRVIIRQEGRTVLDTRRDRR